MGCVCHFGRRGTSWGQEGGGPKRPPRLVACLWGCGERVGVGGSFRWRLGLKRGLERDTAWRWDRREGRKALKKGGVGGGA